MAVIQPTKKKVIRSVLDVWSLNSYVICYTGVGWLFCVENPYGNERRWLGLLQVSWYIPTCRYVVRGYGITSWWCIKERHSGIISWCWVFNCIKREQAIWYLEGRIGFWKWHEQMEIVFCLQKASGPLTHCWIASDSM